MGSANTVAAKLRTFLDEIEGLPPLPAIVQEIAALAASPTTSTADLCQVLSRDPSLAAKILRVVNSPFYGTAREVTHLSRAVVLLGTRAVQNLVFGFCTRSALSPGGTGVSPVPEHEAISRHSVAVASACDVIARYIGFQPVEKAFVAGLLHDVGQLAMIVFRLHEFRETLCPRLGRCDEFFLAAEERCLGVNHAEAGFHILNRWRLPKAYCEVVRHHHATDVPRLCEPCAPTLLAIVMIADTYAQALGFGLDLPAGSSTRLERATAFLDLSGHDQSRILSGLERRIEEAMEMFALAENASPTANAPQRKKALWISRQGDEMPASSSQIGVMLLERFGYEVHHAPPEGAHKGPPDAELVIIDLPSGDAEASALSLSGSASAVPAPDRGSAGMGAVADSSDTNAPPQGGGQGRKILLLREPRNNELHLEKAPNTNVFHIPRLFTIFDLKWIEEQPVR